MISVNQTAQRASMYSAQKQTGTKRNAFSTSFQEAIKSQTDRQDTIQISRKLDISTLADKYDIGNLDKSKREELLTELKQMGEIDSDFHYGFVLLPFTAEDLKNPEKLVEFVPGELEFVQADDMLAFSKQVADSQMALYRKLASEGNVIPKLKEEAEQYRKLAEILEQREKLQSDKKGISYF